MPAGAVYVGRPSLWGNPYRVGENRLGFIVRSACRRLGRPIPIDYERHGGQRHVGEGVLPVKLTAVEAVLCYRGDATAMFGADPSWLDPLRGFDLACWCPLDQPCHADVLLELLGE